MLSNNLARLANASNELPAMQPTAASQTHPTELSDDATALAAHLQRRRAAQNATGSRHGPAGSHVGASSGSSSTSTRSRSDMGGKRGVAAAEQVFSAMTRSMRQLAADEDDDDIAADEDSFSAVALAGESAAEGVDDDNSVASDSEDRSPESLARHKQPQARLQQQMQRQNSAKAKETDETDRHRRRDTDSADAEQAEPDIWSELTPLTPLAAVQPGLHGIGPVEGSSLLRPVPKVIAPVAPARSRPDAGGPVLRILGWGLVAMVAVLVIALILEWTAWPTAGDSGREHGDTEQAPPIENEP